MSWSKDVSDFIRSGKGLMSPNQYSHVAETIGIHSPCNLLVFGLGDDSYLWNSVNNGGKTVFLEDDKDWISQFIGKEGQSTSLDIVQVEYLTQALDHEKIGYNQAELEVPTIPDRVRSVGWDVIFVDGPLGHNPPRPYKGPGRMSSLYEASRLVKPGGVVIVDDIGRLIESKYSIHYFGQENLWKVVENKVAFFKVPPILKTTSA